MSPWLVMPLLLKSFVDGYATRGLTGRAGFNRAVVRAVAALGHTAAK